MLDMSQNAFLSGHRIDVSVVGSNFFWQIMWQRQYNH